MTSASETPLSQVLSQTRSVSTLTDLAVGWHDLRFRYELRVDFRLSIPAFGNHVRRSFLGALAPGASPDARANRPCLWDPPSTLDVFNREQLRGPAGDGLPKPYALNLSQDGSSLVIELTIFGLACDWAHAAAEAMGLGLLSILPWRKVTSGRVSSPPTIVSRTASAASGISVSQEPKSMTMSITHGIDISGKAKIDPAALLSAGIRRVDAVSRWQGLSLDPDTGRNLASVLSGLKYSKSDLKSAVVEMPNKNGQARRFSLVRGRLHIETAPPELQAALLIAERCQLGRGTVWGLGRFELSA